MAFVDVLGQPLRFPFQHGVGLPVFTSGQLTLDETGDKIAFIISVPKAGTLNRVGFRTNAVSQAPTNGLTVSFQDVSAGDPDGTPDQSRNVPVGSIAANTWIETGLITSDGSDTGTKRTVSAGDVVAVVIEFTSFVASDNVVVTRHLTNELYDINPTGLPYVSFLPNGGSWTKQTNTLDIVFALQYSDNVWVPLPNCAPITTIANTFFDSADSPDEKASGFTIPVPMRCVGADVQIINNASGSAAPFDVVLYDSDGGVIRSRSFAAANLEAGVNAARSYRAMWDPVELEANQFVRLAIKPTSGTLTLAVNELTLPSASYRTAVYGNQATFDTRTNEGAWTVGITKTSPWGTLLIDAIDPVKGGFSAPGMLRNLAPFMRSFLR